MTSELTDSGNHARPWVGDDDTVSEPNVLVDFGNALNVAGDRCVFAAERLRRARTEAERDSIRAELRGFIRRTISAADIAFAVLGGELPQPVNGEDR